MRIRDLPQWLETRFEFPVTVDQIKEQAEDIEIEAPDRTDSESLSTILDRSGETTYQSPDEMLDTIRGNLSEDYIGRKYYDDRGGTPSERERDTAERTTADEDSF